MASDSVGLVEAYVVVISGRVQGVGFRWFTEKEARARDVCGYVRNLPDGRVEVFAQGDESTLAFGGLNAVLALERWNGD